jgi:uncharacterized protein YrrD
MTTTFRTTRGLPVIVRSSADRVGAVARHLVRDGAVRAVQVAGGSGDRFVDVSDVCSWGDDAVVVAGSDAVRDAADEWEERVGSGDLEMLDKRVLDDGGDELGSVSDVSFDTESGRLESLRVERESVAADRLRGVGSYAVVVVRLDHR